MLTSGQEILGSRLFGPGLFSQIIAEAEEKSKQLEESGVAYKGKNRRVAHRTKADEMPAGPADPDQPDNLAAMVEAVMEKLQNGPLGEAIAAMEERLAALEEEISQAEKAARTRAKVERPRLWQDVDLVPTGKKAPVYDTPASAFFTGPIRPSGDNPFFKTNGRN